MTPTQQPTQLTTQSSDMTSPYRGLTPYTEADAAYFFGRTAEIATITANLEVARLTLFYGPSGVGKSSVLRAGVIHELTQRAQATFAATGVAEQIPVYFNRWASDPLLGLSQTLAQTVAPYCLHPTAPHPQPTAPLLAQLQQWSEQTDSELLLVLDQFEEFFQYHTQPGSSAPSQPWDPTSFAAQLVQLVNHSALRVHLLLSLREDTLARLDYFQGRIPFLLDNRLSIGHLDRATGAEAVVKPLVRFNQEQQSNYTIEPALVTAVLEQVGSGQVTLSRQGTGTRPVEESDGAPQPLAPIEAPYLQLVLTRLWQQEQRNGSPVLRLTTLNGQLGGAAIIVRNYLDDTLAALTPADRALAARFFDRLVTPSGAKIALTLAELTHYAGAEPAAVAALLEQLQARRLLRPTPAPSGVIQYEIFHDVLGPALLDWQARYQKAQEEEQRLAEEQAALAEAEERRRIEERTQLEIRYNQQLRGWLKGIVAIALIAIGLGLTTLYLWRYQTQAGLARQLDALATSLSASEADTALLLGVEAYKQNNNQFDMRAGLLTAKQCCADNVIAFLRGHSERVWDVSFHPTKKLLASGSSDGTVVIWDLLSTPQIKPIKCLEKMKTSAVAENCFGKTKTSAAVYSVAFSHNGKLLAVGDGDGAIWLRDTNRWLPVGPPLQGHTSNVHGLAFSLDDTLLVSGGADKRVIVWDVATHWEITRSTTHLERVWDVAIAPDNQTVASASFDRTVQLWDIAPPKAVMITHPVTITLSTDAIVTALAFNKSANQLLLATGAANNVLRVWDLALWQNSRERPTKKAESRLHIDTIWGLSFNPVDDTMLASSSESGVIRMWRVDMGKSELLPLTLGLPAGTTGLSRLAFSPDGKTLATGDINSLVTLWKSVESSSVIRHPSPISSVALSSDNKTFIALSTDGTISTWDVTTREQSSEFKKLNTVKKLRLSTISPNGDVAATVDISDTVGLWNIVSGQPLSTSFMFTGTVQSILFSPNSKLLATGASDGTVSLWNVYKGDITHWPAHRGIVNNLAFNPSGTVLASGACHTVIERSNTKICGRSQIRLWTVPNYRERGSLILEASAITALAFQPDKPSLLALGAATVGSLKGSVVILNIDKPTERFYFTSNGELAHALSFRPDGRYLAVGRGNLELALYDTTTGQLFGKAFREHDAAVTKLLFHPNGKLLFSGSRDNTVVVHDLDVNNWLRHSCTLANRNLTQAEWKRYLSGSYQRTCPEFPDGP